MKSDENTQLIPVSKNGKFFGYADEKQLKSNPSLKPYDKMKAAAAIALEERTAAEAELAEQAKVDERNKKAAAKKDEEEDKKQPAKK